MEKVSRDRVTLAPRPRSLEEIQETVRPMTDQELEFNDYPVGESTNRNDLSMEVINEDEQPRTNDNNQPNGRDTTDSTSVEPEQHPILGTTNLDSEENIIDSNEPDLTRDSPESTSDTSQVETVIHNGPGPGTHKRQNNESKDSDCTTDNQEPESNREQHHIDESKDSVNSPDSDKPTKPVVRREQDNPPMPPTRRSPRESKPVSRLGHEQHSSESTPGTSKPKPVNQSPQAPIKVVSTHDK